MGREVAPLVGGQEETSLHRRWGGSAQGTFPEKVLSWKPRGVGLQEGGSSPRLPVPQGGSSGTQVFYLLLWNKEV